ncbi:HAMP domain-containing sensor histidine kinase [Roseateles sp.]|uniref:sensor histidine kinase n=1 Tax=Roseateles sp. TaxID=1971397 RepID=UPI0031DDFC41
MTVAIQPVPLSTSTLPTSTPAPMRCSPAEWVRLIDEPALHLADAESSGDGARDGDHRIDSAWASPALRRACADLDEHPSPAAIERALPGLIEALSASGLAPAPGGAGPVDLALGPDSAWDARAVSLPDGSRLLLLRSRRERVRALQRQLDDREQLLFTSRVISVGEMATTLAHELNQPIGSANNLLRGLRMRLSRRSGPAALSAQESAALEQSIEQLMFASRVIARVREFTHSRQPRQQRIDLGELARESAALLDWDLQRNGVRLSLDLPDAPLHVRGDATMLQQVLVNLMRNALDAMRQSPPPDAPRLALILRPADTELDATLTVRDNGCGLSESTESRLFVPFNSTKPSGMGVGLAICRSFVELHQGRLWFTRNEDRGCSFHVDLPLIPESDTPASIHQGEQR